MPILIALLALAGAIFAAGSAILLAILEAASKAPRKTTRRRRRPSNKMHSAIHREISPEEFEELIRGIRP